MLEIVIHPQESACVILVEMDLTAQVSCRSPFISGSKQLPL